eukprot:COSAG03_NODE_1704_length_3622_cov_51.818904_2_plen_210_part_00
MGARARARERERERERESVCVCERERERERPVDEWAASGGCAKGPGHCPGHCSLRDGPCQRDDLVHRLIALPVRGARQLPQAATGAQRLAQLSQAPNGTVLGRLHETAPRGFGGPPKLAAAGPRLSRGQAASSPPARCVEYVPTAPPEPSDTVTVASPNALAAKQRSARRGRRTHARTHGAGRLAGSARDDGPRAREILDDVSRDPVSQ